MEGDFFFRTAGDPGKIGCTQGGSRKRYFKLQRLIGLRIVANPNPMKSIRIRLGALALFLGIVPLFLPRRPRIARRILIHADRSHVFPLINDLRNWPRWTAWNQRQEIGYQYDGPPAGAGATQHWRCGSHSGVLHVTQSHEGERIAYTLMMDDRWLLEGAISLEEIAPQQTRVLWLARWQGAAWPWARYMDLLMMAWIARDFSMGLANLKDLAETTAPVAQAAL